MLKVKITLLTVLSFILLSVLALPGQAQKDKDDKKGKEHYTGTPVLWREPTDIASRDLFLGPGGGAMKPDLSRVTFVKEEKTGHSKKYVVKDGRGMEWRVKFSNEAQSETAASRLVWAAGYFTDVDYYVPEVTIEGKGVVKNARFEARPKGIKRIDDEWDWDNNPFGGTQELQGLKVMMVLLNNWDLKTANNRVLVVPNPTTGTTELRYIVSDLGATLGKYGNSITHNRNEPKDYSKSKLIKQVDGERIIFAFHATRDKMLENVTVSNAKWIANILSQLSDQQVSDAFRAGGYSPEEIQLLTQAFRARVNELANLPGGTQTAATN
jgi:hypothetical protein